MTAPTSCPDPARLKELLDGTLPEDEQSVLGEHLNSCASCQETLEGLVAGRDSWTGAARRLGEDAAADSVLQQAVAELEAEGNRLTTATGPAADEELRLDFLSPSEKPGHLGRLGHYEVLEVVGRGGMGVVLKAFDEALHRVVAIKVMAPQLAANATARKRFQREAQAAAAVSHDHVVTIHAVEEADGLPYLVMQYVHGVSLQQRLDRDGPLELKEILRIGHQAASGLAAAHAQGLVHRDIKPGNILLENGVERVKLTDFGLARAVDDASISQSGIIAGTPQYMAPEQARGGTVDHRADLFSLGSVLYVMCTGRAPFRASTTMAVLKRVCEDTPQPIQEINADIPDWLGDIIAKLHAKDPAERFQSASEVADLLGQHLAHMQQPALVPRPPQVAVPRSPRPAEPATARGDRSTTPRWHRWIGPAIGALVLIFVLAVRFGPAVVNLVTMGTLVVDVSAPDVQVVIKQHGQEVAVLHTDSKQEISLPAGTYSLEVVHGPTRRVESLAVERHGLLYTMGNSLDPTDRFDLGLGRGERVVLTISLADVAPQRAQDHAGWVSLFNGKDLIGWKAHPDQPGNWRVEDGILIAKADPYSHLFSERGDFENFHLRAEVKINDQGNSGVFFRSEFGLNQVLVNEKGDQHVFPRGYEAQICTDDRDPPKTGSLWGFGPETRIEEALIPPDTWFTLEVIADGNHIIIKVNGKTTVDFVDAENTHARGHLALQVFFAGAEVRFRKIEVKQLPPSKPTPVARRPSPTSPDEAKQLQQQWAARLKTPVVVTSPVGMKLALVPPGEFLMGTSPAEVERLTELLKREDGSSRKFALQRLPGEAPQHRVAITRPFYLGVYEVTVGQFRRFVDATGHQTDAEKDPKGGYGWEDGKWQRRPGFSWRNPGFTQADDHPVCNLSWDDAQAFCRWLSDQEKAGYRLPTEAEWEYACRAGTATRFHSGDEEEGLRVVANLADASLREKCPSVTWARPWDDSHAFTAPVGRFQPNALGLYDMHGNAWEWCADWYDPGYYARSLQRDPPGPDAGKYRVFRGGGWDNSPFFCRSADRYSTHSETLRTVWAGFRVARAVPDIQAGK